VSDPTENYYGDHTGLWYFALANRNEGTVEYGPYATRLAALAGRAHLQAMLEGHPTLCWTSDAYEDRLRFAEMPSFIDGEEGVTLYPPIGPQEEA